MGTRLTDIERARIERKAADIERVIGEAMRPFVGTTDFEGAVEAACAAMVAWDQQQPDGVGPEACVALVRVAAAEVFGPAGG